MASTLTFKEKNALTMFGKVRSGEIFRFYSVDEAPNGWGQYFIKKGLWGAVPVDVMSSGKPVKVKWATRIITFEIVQAGVSA
ncbi:MAG TPA: hypothetical protein VGL56_10255 [Fimbriimonadaceae bacterium]|jgi:hypothetical protein